MAITCWQVTSNLTHSIKNGDPDLPENTMYVDFLTITLSTETKQSDKKNMQDLLSSDAIMTVEKPLYKTRYLI